MLSSKDDAQVTSDEIDAPHSLEKHGDADGAQPLTSANAEPESAPKNASPIIRNYSNKNRSTRGSVHSLMFEHEQKRSSIIDLPLVAATYSDSFTMNSDMEDEPVFYDPAIEPQKNEATSNTNKIESLSAMTQERLELLQHGLPAGLAAEIRLCSVHNLNASTVEVGSYDAHKTKICATNPWLKYAPSLHRCRELGFHHRTVDLLDQRLLNKDELREFLVVMFGKKFMLHAPDLHTEWIDFVNFLSSTSAEVQTGMPGHWIDMQKLEALYGGGQVMHTTSGSYSRKVNQPRKDQAVSTFVEL